MKKVINESAHEGPEERYRRLMREAWARIKSVPKRPAHKQFLRGLFQKDVDKL